MKSEQEKIAMCTRFLESRGYTVFSEYMTTLQIAYLLGVSNQSITGWTNLNSRSYKQDFPKPLAVKGGGKSHRFRSKDVLAWADKHCDVVKG